MENCKRKMFLGFLMLLFCSVMVLNAGSNIVGYNQGSSVWSTNIFPCQLDATKLTHLIYAFAGFDADGNVVVGPGDTHPETSTAFTIFENCPLCLYRQVCEAAQNDGNDKYRLKAQNTSLKTLISFGGAGTTTNAYFYDVLSDNTKRANLVNSILTFLQNPIYYDTGNVNDMGCSFDGVDIDWEFPGFHPTGTDLCTTFMAELYAALNPHGFMITMATSYTRPWGFRDGQGNYTVQAYWEFLDTIEPYVDWFNVMTYDMVIAGNNSLSPWNDTTGYNAPLYPYGTRTDCIDTTVNGYGTTPGILSEISADKVVIGLPFYGRSYGNITWGSSLGAGNSYTMPGVAGPVSNSSGYLMYSELVKLFATSDGMNNPVGTFLQDRDSSAQVPYGYDLHTYKKLQSEWISYDDPISLTAKVSYVKSNNLLGVMIWALEQDYIAGGAPLLNAVYDAMQDS